MSRYELCTALTECVSSQRVFDTGHQKKSHYHTAAVYEQNVVETLPVVRRQCCFHSCMIVSFYIISLSRTIPQLLFIVRRSLSVFKIFLPTSGAVTVAMSSHSVEEQDAVRAQCRHAIRAVTAHLGQAAQYLHRNSLPLSYIGEVFNGAQNGNAHPMRLMLEAEAQKMEADALALQQQQQQRIEQLNTELQASATELANVNGQLTAVQGQLTTVTDQLTRTERERARLEAALNSRNGEFARVTNELQTTTNECDDARAQISRDQSAYRVLLEEKRALEFENTKLKNGPANLVKVQAELKICNDELLKPKIARRIKLTLLLCIVTIVLTFLGQSFYGIVEGAVHLKRTWMDEVAGSECNARLRACINFRDSLHQDLVSTQEQLDGVKTACGLKTSQLEEQKILLTRSLDDCRQQSEQNLTALRAGCVENTTKLERNVSEAKQAYANLLMDNYKSEKEHQARFKDLEKEHQKCLIDKNTLQETNAGMSASWTSMFDELQQNYTSKRRPSGQRIRGTY